MAPRMSVGQLPEVLLWNYFFFTLLRGRCPGCILRSLDDEQVRLSQFFEHTKIRMGETIVAARGIVHNFLDGDGYFDASLIPKALSLISGGLFLFLMKLFVAWRRINYIMFVMFYYLLQTFTQVVLAGDHRQHRQP